MLSKHFALRPARMLSGLCVVLTVVLGFLLLLAASVSSQDTMSADLVQVTSANAQFANKLYNIVSEEDGNVFFSPISAHAVLSMAYQGSAGKTSQEFANTLHVSNQKSAANGYKDIMTTLNNIEKVTLHIANKIFLMQNYPLKSAFKQATSELFLSEIEPVNFAENVKAANTINGWVENKTNSKIKDLISPDSLNGLTRLVLVNAIYFKGNWANQFDKGATQTEPFYVTKDKKVDCQMMHINKRFGYREDENLDAKVLELPYDNDNVSMVIILPNAVDGIANLEKKLDGVDLSKLTQQMRPLEVNVSLPRFKIETTLELKEVLQKMGLGSIFDSGADFSEISESPESLYVSKVIQKAFIEVNEEGAEAAAATGMVMMTRCLLPPREKKDFRADHPFIIALLHKHEASQSVLFFGRISNPNA